MRYYEYAKNDIDKWEKLIGFKVCNHNTDVGDGTIKDVRLKKGYIYLDIYFPNDKSTGEYIKKYTNDDLEEYCFIENLDDITEFVKYVRQKNGNILKKDKVKYLTPIKKRKDKLGEVTFKECITNENYLKDKVYKEEAINLAYILRYLGKQIDDVKSIIESYKDSCELTYSPTVSEMRELAYSRQERRKYYKSMEELECRFEKPYFSRIDMSDKTNKVMKVYIGERGIVKNGVDIVYDWRTPLGQRYYRRSELEFSLNNNSYRIDLIRALEIKEAILQNYQDEYVREGIKNIENTNKGIEEINKISVSDPFLIRILKGKRNVSDITNIISSIQENQNKIITEDIESNIIVQGCAGSGKTMILTHRLSYLLYNNPELDIKRVNIITPNNLFKMSINNLTRELGIDNINKLSIEEYMESKINEYGLKFKGKITTNEIPYDVYNFIYSNEFLKLLEKAYYEYINFLWGKFSEDNINTLIGIYKIEMKNKGPINKDFAEIVRLSKRLNEELSKKEDKYEDIKKEIIDYTDIQDSIYREMETLIQLNEVTELINKQKDIKWFNIGKKNEVKKRIKELFVFLSIEVEKSEEEKVILNITDRVKENIRKYEEKLDEYKETNNSIKQKLNEYKKSYFLGYEPIYLRERVNKLIELINSHELDFLNEKIYEPLIEKISKRFKYDGYKKKSRIKLFSILNLLYIHKGSLIKLDRIICIDEGQDINKLEYKLINTINGGNLIFNIFGDVNQRVELNKGIDNWDILKSIKSFKRYELNENYRNSQEVAKKCIIETGYNMIPVGVDDGNVYKITENEEVSQTINYFIDDSSNRKIVIVKEIDKNVKMFLGKYFKGYSVNIIYENNILIRTDRVNVITVKMVKGMEFDTTLVLTKHMNNNEKYIALTRALINNYIIDVDI